MSRDPWENLTVPDVADAINARRVSTEIPWNFFWARDIEGRCLLILRHDIQNSPKAHLPRLKGIEVGLPPNQAGDGNMLFFRLTDLSQRDIFHRLCDDIIERATEATSEKEAVAVALSRTWRWHHLLRGGRDGRLSIEEQKGLIGELFVLERFLFPSFSIADAVSSWKGPLGAPKDFEVCRTAIEAKARRGGAKPFVLISSEDQLDESGIEHLFLYVVDLDRAVEASACSFCLTDVVVRVGRTISEGDPLALEIFESLITAAGYKSEDDYSDFPWVEGAGRIYSVVKEFPRITGGTLLSGVTNVKYSISMAECAPFQMSAIDLRSILEELSHGS